MSVTHTKVISPKYPTAVIGNSFYQRPLNTIIRRMTNSQRVFAGGNWKPGTIIGGNTTNSEPHWSNCTDTLMLAGVSIIENGAHKDVIGVFGQDMRYLTTLPPRISQYNLRWDTVDPACFYHFTGSRVEKWDVRAMRKRQWTLGFPVGLAGGEGDVSDTNEILLDKDGKVLFIYDLNKMATVSGSYSPSTLDLGSLGAKGAALGVDYATLSQDGQYILVSWSGQCGTHGGIEVYSRKWEYLHRIYPPVPVHWCSALDTSGNPVIYTTLPFGHSWFIEPYAALVYKPGDYVKIRVDTGAITRLLSLPKWTHHMTCKRRGYREVVYTVFDERELKPSVKSLWTQPDWAPYFGELVEIDTDGGGVRRLCHVWSRPSKVVKKPGKWWQSDPFAFGNKVGFRSCVVNDDVPAMATGIGDMFYVEV